MKQLYKKGIFPIGAYCSPQPPACVDGVEYPNKITHEQYQMLADLGVNLVYAHNEVFGTDTEKYAFEALDLAEKVGVKVYVRDVIAREYATTAGDKDKWYKTLTQEERADLDKRFEESLKRYCKHPAFGGISFWDEPGYDAFEGIGAAKRVFERVCPNKTFYVNMFPYYISPEQFQFGYWAGLKTEYKATIPEFAIREDGRNIERYKKLYEGAVEIAKLNFFSYDAYPFVTLGEGGETGVHEALWEIPQYLCGMEKKLGIPFWSFLQVGGQWEGRKEVRITTLGETRLGVSVPLLYGAKGLQLFPYMMPNDWLGDKKVDAGVVNEQGEKTERYDWYKELFAHVQAMSKTLLKSKLKAIVTAGEYKNGIDEEKFSKVHWNELIFRGKLSACESIDCNRYGDVRKVNAKSQVLIGCFDTDGKETYLVVNNSSINPTSVEIEFKSNFSRMITQSGRTRVAGGKYVDLELKAGECVLVEKI